MIVLDISKTKLSIFSTLYSFCPYDNSFQNPSHTMHNSTIVYSNITLFASNFKHVVISSVNGDASDYVISSCILVFRWYMFIFPLK